MVWPIDYDKEKKYPHWNATNIEQYKYCILYHLQLTCVDCCLRTPLKENSIVSSWKEEHLQLSLRWSWNKNYESSGVAVSSQGQLGLREKLFFCGPIEKGAEVLRLKGRCYNRRTAAL